MPQACRADDPLLTSNQVACWLGVKVETVRDWARRGRIPCLRASRRIIRFRMADVERAAFERGIVDVVPRLIVRQGLRLYQPDETRDGAIDEAPRERTLFDDLEGGHAT